MASTPEGKVKAAIKLYLRSIGAWFFMPIGGPYTVAGIPDFVGCWKGKLFAIEAKRPGNKGGTTANQKLQIGLIQAAGGIAFVADCVEDVKLRLG